MREKLEIDNVSDRRHGWIGSWEAEPLDAAALTPADIGRTVIYQDHGRAEAGTLTAWRGDIVWARYSTGDTSSSAHACNLFFGTRPLDGDAGRAALGEEQT